MYEYRSVDNLQTLFKLIGIYLRRDLRRRFEDLRRRFDDLRRCFEDLRRRFEEDFDGDKDLFLV